MCCVVNSDGSGLLWRAEHGVVVGSGPGGMPMHAHVWVLGAERETDTVQVYMVKGASAFPA